MYPKAEFPRYVHTVMGIYQEKIQKFNPYNNNF